MHVCVSLHLCTRLQRLGFETFTEEVESVLKDHKQQQKVRMGVYASLLTVSHPYRRTGSGKSTRWLSVASRRRSCSPSKKHSSRRAAKSSARPSSDLPAPLAVFVPVPSLVAPAVRPPRRGALPFAFAFAPFSMGYGRSLPRFVYYGISKWCARVSYTGPRYSPYPRVICA